MGKNYKNNIELTTGYTLTAETPIDDRLSVASIDDLHTLVINRSAYDGIIVAVKDKGIYKYNKTSNTWIRQATVKSIEQNGQNVEVLNELLDINSVAEENIKDSAITGSKIKDGTISVNKISDSFKNMLANGRAQKFVDFTEPTETSYIDTKYNPSVGDIYLHLEDDGVFCKGIYIRTELLENRTIWSCIWSWDGSIKYLNGANIQDGTIRSSALAKESVTENALSSELKSILIKGTYGTAPMNEGDTLKAGQIYIQYDETI